MSFRCRRRRRRREEKQHAARPPAAVQSTRRLLAVSSVVIIVAARESYCCCRRRGRRRGAEEGKATTHLDLNTCEKRKVSSIAHDHHDDMRQQQVVPLDADRILFDSCKKLTVTTKPNRIQTDDDASLSCSIDHRGARSKQDECRPIRSHRVQYLRGSVLLALSCLFFARLNSEQERG